MRPRSCARADSRPKTSPTRERAGFRRAIAQRCLYGVDINPMAVQLGRLSLWLATLSADRPLTFLDHRLRTGNSLVGASPADIARQPPGGDARARPARASALWRRLLRRCLRRRDRRQVAHRDGTWRHARAGAREGARAHGADQRRRAGRAMEGGVRPVVRRVVWRARPAPRVGAVRRARGRDSRARHSAATRRGAARRRVAGASAARERFFHWTFEFPEIFRDALGEPLPAPGFDAIVGNPPWEMLRGDRGDADTQGQRRGQRPRSSRTSRAAPASTPRRATATSTSISCSSSGRSRCSATAAGSGWCCLRASRPTAGRRRCDARSSIGHISTRSSRSRIASGCSRSHRSLKFLLVSATVGGRTDGDPVPLRHSTPGRPRPAAGARPGPQTPSRSPRPLLEHLSGEQIAVPDVRSTRDVDILAGDRLRHSRAWRRRPAGTSTSGASSTRPTTAAISPAATADFRSSKASTSIRSSSMSSAARLRIAPDAGGAALVDPARTFGRARLGYREVASATNRLTLIAAIVPAGAITTHTVFCLKEPLDDESQWYLCGMLNSFVANYLVRLRVSTHVSSGIIDRLPVPVPHRDAPRRSRNRRARQVTRRSAGRGGGERAAPGARCPRVRPRTVPVSSHSRDVTARQSGRS